MCTQQTTKGLAVPVTLSPVEIGYLKNHITIVSNNSMTIYNSLDTLADLTHCVNK